MLTSISASIGGTYSRAINARWHNTAAVTELTFSLPAGNFANGSVITVWGLT